MGEESNVKFTSGYLYIYNPDGSYDQFGKAGDLNVTNTAYADDQDYIPAITGLTSTFEVSARISKETLFKLLGVYNAIVNLCPNKRVVHLVLNGRTPKIRKKNLHRAIKILEGMTNGS